MIKVETLMKQGDKFVPIDEFSNTIPDEDYIEGAIELRIDNEPLLTREQWDYIDQLWAYLVDGLCEIEHGNSYEMRFPDQPIKLSLTPTQQSGHIKVRVESGEQEVEATTSLDAFMAEMLKAAMAFFGRIQELLPKESYLQILINLQSLSRQRATHE